MFNYRDYKVFMACGATDFRKSINGLCEIVEMEFEFNPREKIFFAFCNKSRNLVKLLVWEENGFWIHLKHIEKRNIFWPESLKNAMVMDFSVEDFVVILKLPGLKQKVKRQEI